MKSLKKLVVLVTSENVRDRPGSDFLAIPLRNIMPNMTVVGSDSCSDALKLLEDVSIAIVMVHRCFSNSENPEAKRFKTLVEAIRAREIPWIAMAAFEQTFSFVKTCDTAAAFASEDDFKVARLKEIIEKVINEQITP